MKITYQSQKYSPEIVTARYVRRTCAAGGYDWCEVGQDRRYDVRQGTVEADELSDEVRGAADENYKVSMSYVSWPRSVS
jgi:hypothetical protein